MCVHIFMYMYIHVCVYVCLCVCVCTYLCMYSGTSHSDPSQQRKPPNSVHYLRHRFTSPFTLYIGDLPGAETPQFRIATPLEHIKRIVLIHFTSSSDPIFIRPMHARRPRSRASACACTTHMRICLHIAS